jgi:hypothetical protein
MRAPVPAPDRIRGRKRTCARGLAGLALAIAALALAAPAAAQCCRLVKTSVVVPLSEVRVCEPNEQGACGKPLFVGTIEPGDAHEVCSESGTLTHQTYDDEAGGYSEPVTAACNGGDVEL